MKSPTIKTLFSKQDDDKKIHKTIIFSRRIRRWAVANKYVQIPLLDNMAHLVLWTAVELDEVLSYICQLFETHIADGLLKLFKNTETLLKP